MGNTKPAKMILGTGKVLNPTTDAAQRAEKNTRAKNRPSAQEEEKASHPFIERGMLKEVQQTIAAGSEKLSQKERERIAILSEPTQTVIYLNPVLQEYHDRLRERNRLAFGLVQYGALLHVGISRIRAMTPEARMELLKANTRPHVSGKMNPLKMTRACYLDMQRLQIQIREELWLDRNSQSFGMPELIPMVDAVTSSMDLAEIRAEYSRITTRRL